MKEQVDPIPASRNDEKENVQFYKLEEKFSTTYFRKQRLHDETRITSFTVAKQSKTVCGQDVEFAEILEGAKEITKDEIYNSKLEFFTK